MNNTASVVDEIFDLVVKHGSQQYHGEPVSQLEHMSQSAQLAIEEGSDDEIILAAFLHDIGHICETVTPQNAMGKLGIMHHEKIGADFLRARDFPEKIARMVENHVRAKRYLTFKFPDYYNQLSEASKKTLEFQGGPMSLEEVSAFEDDPLFEISLKLRTWDEMAKVPNLSLIDLNVLKMKTIRILNNNLSLR